MLDERSDLFSFGSVLYELLVGGAAFAAPSQAEILSAILTREPSWPPDAAHLPGALRHIVDKCLQKDRERRYQSARELLADLRTLHRESESTIEPPSPTRVRRGGVLAAVAVLGLAVAGWSGWTWWRGHDAGIIHSIAVLPFTNVNADQDIEYLADGVTDGIISELSQLPDLKVLSHTAVFHYKGRDVDAREVGRDLGAEAILTGRLVKRGDDLSVHVEPPLQGSGAPGRIASGRVM